MDRLHSPWRSKYIESFARKDDDKGGCILCDAALPGDDDARLIVARKTTCFVILNLYPYNSGHCMVVPYRHMPDIADLSDAESAEAVSLVKDVTRALRTVSSPDGFNVGCNIGRSAGAGIERHIHFHVVPRWNGDTNFMPVLADTKMISEDMQETLRKLRRLL